MPVAHLPVFLTVATFAVFVAGNVLGWVTHDPQTAGIGTMGAFLFLRFPDGRSLQPLRARSDAVRRELLDVVHATVQPSHAVL